ncbi:MAG: 2-C-methyl-D-erythritol 2,4-cyclodiphosphate synthase [Pyrinomonadaceae bacterium]
MQGMFRIGFGNDIHRLEAGRELIIGGTLITAEFGAVGHSDADVLIHAVTDAVLGALALGDIGRHFSDSDSRWQNADSSLFLREALKMGMNRGYTVVNLDSVVSLEKPKLKEFIPQMRMNLAELLETEISNVSIKAKTGEGIESIGESRAVKAEACILLTKNQT